MGNMTFGNWITVIGTGLASAFAAAGPFIPAPYNAAAAGGIALLGALLHLFAQSPAPSTRLR